MMLLNILKRVESPEEEEEEVAPRVLTVEATTGGGEEPRGYTGKRGVLGLRSPHTTSFTSTSRVTFSMMNMI
jgi:hypothetical protein